MAILIRIWLKCFNIIAFTNTKNKLLFILFRSFTMAALCILKILLKKIRFYTTKEWLIIFASHSLLFLLIIFQTPLKKKRMLHLIAKVFIMLKTKLVLGLFLSSSYDLYVRSFKQGMVSLFSVAKLSLTY